MPRKEYLVNDLIRLLMAQPQDARVVLEGCDCSGAWDGTVEFSADREDGDYVLLGRD